MKENNIPLVEIFNFLSSKGIDDMYILFLIAKSFKGETQKKELKELIKNTYDPKLHDRAKIMEICKMANINFKPKPKKREEWTY